MSDFMTARGYSLPLVLLLMSVLAAAGTAAALALSGSTAATATMINRRQAFYACDGVGRAAMVKAREYMRTDATPTTPELKIAVCGSPSGCTNANDYTMSGFNVDTLDLTTTGSTSVQSLPNGPFRGMTARQTDVFVVVEATKTSTNARCRIDQEFALGEIGLFQFFVFSDGYMDLFNVGTMSIAGRVHVNGDFCAHTVGAADVLTIDTVTASGRILSGGHCPLADQGSGPGFGILDAATSGTYRSIGATNDHTCASCTPTPGAGAWATYATMRWGGNALDTAHSVPNLRLPIVGTVAVQDGKDATNGAIDNSQTLKMLLDPVRAGDNTSTLQQRYAAKADIVIVNGIWFRRQTGVPWPGTPIWSDHPGNYSTNCADDEGAVTCAGAALPLNVGQRDLFSGARPVRYSYYQHDGASPGAMQNADLAQRPVISYGTIAKVGSSYEPAYWSAASTLSPANEVAQQLLDGTRSGFQDFRVRRAVTGGEHKMLPMNFDIAALTGALQDTDSGELGSLFDGGAAFNGIVYIVNTWPGWDANMSASTAAQATPPLWPTVDGGTATPNLTASVLGDALSARESARLPRNLCSAATGTPTNLTAAGSVLPSPDCAHVSGTRPSSLRIINGASIDTTVFPHGLSIASNQALYIVGDLNTASVTVVGPTITPTVSWRPLMIGGDAITLLSNAWSDAAADWMDTNGATQLDLRPAAATTYVLSSISGNVETSATMRGGGINNFPRFLEDWAGIESRIYGSLVIGFRSSYQWQPFTGSGGTAGVYEPPNRLWLYDTNLNLPSQQPPGTPSFFVQAIQQWQRE